MSGGISRFFSIRHEISARCQDLVKDINPTTAAILAVYPDIGPRYTLSLPALSLARLAAHAVDDLLRLGAGISFRRGWSPAFPQKPESESERDDGAEGKT
jgi:hypothetical protein